MSEVNFIANARIKDVVGRELINDDNIAVAELVKNAIDAKARRVDIVFEGADKGGGISADSGGRIVIVDDGVGMNAEDIQGKWLNIAYSEKRAPLAGRKFLAGNKGIGRFSCDRLGRRLRLLSLKEGDSPLSLNIDWGRFEGVGMDKEVSDIPLALRRETMSKIREGLPARVSREFSHGVILEMTPLRGEWNRKKILALRRLLEKMVNLHESMLANRQCQIHVHAPELGEGLTGRIENRIFDKLGIEATSIESRIVSGGKRVETEITDRGRMVAKITVEGEFPGGKPYPALEDARISLHYMNRYKKAMFARETGQTTIEFGSVFLFLNGFRVPPYGDRGNDWLSLDNRKTQGTMRYLGTRDVLGRIELRDSGGNFEVVSSREGVVHNDAYRQLVDVDRGGNHAAYGGYFYDVLGRLESYVVEGLHWDSLPKGIGENEIEKMLDEGVEEVYQLGRGEKDRRVMRALHKIIAPPKKGRITKVEISPFLLSQLREEEKERAAKVIGYLGGLSSRGILAADQPRALAEIRDHIERQETRIKAASEGRDSAEKRAALEKERAAVERSRRMFLEGQFTPEMKRDMAGMWNMIHQMSIKLGSLSHNIQRVARHFSGNIPASVLERFAQAQQLIAEVRALCRHVVRGSFEDAYAKTTGDIPEFVRGYAENRAQDALVGDMRFSCAPGLKFASKFSPMNLTVVLDNLVDNARKAAERFRRKPNILIQASSPKGGREVILRFSDDAGGLDESIKDPESVFGLGFTRTNGMGLGLHIVREIVEGREMRGKIRCVPLKDGTEFEIKLPKR